MYFYCDHCIKAAGTSYLFAMIITPLLFGPSMIIQLSKISVIHRPVTFKRVKKKLHFQHLLIISAASLVLYMKKGKNAY